MSGSRNSKGREPGMAKEIFVAYGIDVDAVAGWLGSYGGEDSPCDITRGLFAGEVGSPRLLRMFERWGIKTTWFIPGHSIETFPEGDAGGRRCRPRDRHARLQPREPGRHDARAGRGDLRQVHRRHHQARRQAAARLRRAVVGARPEHRRAAAPQGHQIRPLHDEQRLPSLLCAGRATAGRRSTTASIRRPG